MNSIYQHPRDLRFALFDGEPTFPMTILEEAHVTHGLWTFRFCIIGESHATTIYHAGEPMFSEVLACYPVQPEQCTRLYTFDHHERHEVAQERYRGAVAFDHPTWPEPDAFRDQQLEVVFPSTFGEVPVTRVQWHTQDSVMQWWTLHTYPLTTGTTYVYTRSSFDFASIQQGEHYT